MLLNRFGVVELGEELTSNSWSAVSWLSAVGASTPDMLLLRSTMRVMRRHVVGRTWSPRRDGSAAVPFTGGTSHVTPLPPATVAVHEHGSWRDREHDAQRDPTAESKNTCHANKSVGSSAGTVGAAVVVGVPVVGAAVVGTAVVGTAEVGTAVVGARDVGDVGATVPAGHSDAPLRSNPHWSVE